MAHRIVGHKLTEGNKKKEKQTNGEIEITRC